MKYLTFTFLFGKILQNDNELKQQKDNEMKEVRLVLNVEDYEYIREFLEKRKAKKNVINNFIQAQEDYLKRTANKRTATAKATEQKVKRVKEKINNAIQLLKFMQKKVTPYTIAKEAGISYNTAKKYKDYINSKIN